MQTKFRSISRGVLARAKLLAQTKSDERERRLRVWDYGKGRHWIWLGALPTNVFFAGGCSRVAVYTARSNTPLGEALFQSFFIVLSSILRDWIMWFYLSQRLFYSNKQYLAFQHIALSLFSRGPLDLVRLVNRQVCIHGVPCRQQVLVFLSRKLQTRFDSLGCEAYFELHD